MSENTNSIQSRVLPNPVTDSMSISFYGSFSTKKMTYTVNKIIDQGLHAQIYTDRVIDSVKFTCIWVKNPWMDIMQKISLLKTFGA